MDYGSFEYMLQGRKGSAGVGLGEAEKVGNEVVAENPDTVDVGVLVSMIRSVYGIVPIRIVGPVD